MRRSCRSERVLEVAAVSDEVCQPGQLDRSNSLNAAILTLNKRSYSGFMIDDTTQADVLLFCVGVCAWSCLYELV